MQSITKSIPPSVAALLLQCTAFLIILLVTSVSGLSLPTFLLACLCGLLAATFSFTAGLMWWWLVIQLLFAPALVLMLTFKFPPGLFLGGFLFLLVVYWSTFRTQVPLYLSSRGVWHAIEKFLPVHQDNVCFSFLDLGSGLGGVLTHLARIRPDGTYLGVETAPLPFLWSWLRIRLMGHRECQVHWQSLWDCDLSKYDVVFAYLSPVPMEKLWHKARAEMRPGSTFISSSFAVPSQSPHETLRVEDARHTTLLIWHM